MITAPRLSHPLTLEALEGETIEDPEDMAAAIVNHAMTWAARCIAQELWVD